MRVLPIYKLIIVSWANEHWGQKATPLEAQDEVITISSSYSTEASNDQDCLNELLRPGPNLLAGKFQVMNGLHSVPACRGQHNDVLFLTYSNPPNRQKNRAGLWNAKLAGELGSPICEAPSSHLFCSCLRLAQLTISIFWDTAGLKKNNRRDLSDHQVQPGVCVCRGGIKGRGGEEPMKDIPWIPYTL